MRKGYLKIQELSEVFDGPHATPTKTEEGPFYLSISSLKNGTLDLSQSARLSELDFLKWTKRVTPKKGDLLFSYETRLGEAALMPDGIKACLGRRMGIVRPDPKRVLPEYLLYSYLAPEFQSVIASNTITGATVDRLSLTDFQTFEMRVPPIEQQRRVASVLSALDAKISLNNRINKQLEEMAKLLYDYWFVQFDFPITAAQAAAMGKPRLEGKPYRASGGKMIFNEALKRKIPEGWLPGNLEMLGKIVGGSTPSTKKTEYFCKVGTPWVTPKDLSDNSGNRFIDHGALDVTSEGIKAASLKLLPAGTVLMSSRAPIGYLGIARNPVTTNQGFKSFVSAKGYSSDYIYFTLKHFMKLIKANASGSTFKEISGGTLKAVQIHLPLGELVAKFTEHASRLSSQQSLLEQQNQQLIELRDWLLPMLMNGQVTVS